MVNSDEMQDKPDRDGDELSPPHAVPDENAEQAEIAAREEFEEAVREREQFKRLAQRTQADLANYRKRVAEERAEAEERAIRRFAARIIEVVDQFDAAMSKDAAKGVADNWLKGVDAIKRNFNAALASQGFERYDADGKQFDPRLHEALISTPTQDHEPNRVIRVLRPGYKHNGEVVRPALVEVAAPDERSEET